MTQQICIFGEVLFDIFPDGHQVLGGAPFNVAWHLQAFGQNPQFISRVGDDPQGDSIRGAMRDWGMSTDTLQTDPALPTGKVTIELKNGEPAYDIVSPCAYDAIDPDPDSIPQCALLYHGSLALRHAESAAALDRLIDAGPGCIFVDVNLRPPWWQKEQVLSQIKRAHWTKLNVDEFDLLHPGHDPINQRIATFIESYELDAVILTHGSEGAEVMQKNGDHFSVTPEQNIDVVDTVGAGDAFTSIMIMGIVHQWPMQTTLERAQQLASSIVGQRGATVSDPEFYKQFSTYQQ